MKISIIGTNGMLSDCLTKCLFNDGHTVNTFGLEKPENIPFSGFTKLNLLKDKLNYEDVIDSDLIIYAVGAGVQAALNTDSKLMYALNVHVPIEITLDLKTREFKGVFISFGSYMEIGLNNETDRIFDETDLVCSSLAVTNDYALSKRLFSRYIKDFCSDFKTWHFILPNLFSYVDNKPGTRLIPYVLNYLENYRLNSESKTPAFSAGTQTRQYILMEEILTVIHKSFLNKLPSGVYNIGGGEFMTVRNLIERLFVAYNVPCEDSYFGKETRRDGDIKSLQIDGSKLFNHIHYLPSLKIEDIITK